MSQAVIINNENLLQQLKKLVDNPSSIENHHLEIGDIEPIEIKLIGDLFHHSLTPTVMRGLLEFQESIYRSYCIARYGNDSLTNLSPYEKESLELVFTIESGCTEIFGQIKELLVALKDLLVDMTPKQKLAVIGIFFITIAGIYSATLAKDYYIEKDKNETTVATQKDDNATKVALEKEKTEQLKITQENMLKSFEAGIESQKPTSATATTDTKPHVKAELPLHTHENYFKVIAPVSEQTQEIIDRVRQEYPVADQVSATLNKGVEKLIHATRQADLVKYNNTLAMSGDVAKTISFEPRATSSTLILNDKFRVLDLDSRRTDIRKTRLRSPDGVEFSAEFTDGTIGKEKMDKLLLAFKGYHPVELAIEAKQIRNKIHSAIIKQVREVDTKFSFKDEEENV